MKSVDPTINKLRELHSQGIISPPTGPVGKMGPGGDPTGFPCAEYFEQEAKNAFHARDEARRKLREAEDRIKSLEKKASQASEIEKFYQQFYKDKRYGPVQTLINGELHKASLITWILREISLIETEGRYVCRIDCHPLCNLRDMGTSVLSPAQLSEREDGLAGTFVPAEVPVYFNIGLASPEESDKEPNTFRFYSKPFTMRPFDFPIPLSTEEKHLEVVKDLSEPESFKETICPHLATMSIEIREELGLPLEESFTTEMSGEPVNTFSGPGRMSMVCLRPVSRTSTEFLSRLPKMKECIIRELRAGQAEMVGNLYVSVIPEPKKLSYDVVLAMPFSHPEWKREGFKAGNEVPVNSIVS